MGLLRSHFAGGTAEAEEQSACPKLTQRVRGVSQFSLPPNQGTWLPLAAFPHPREDTGLYGHAEKLPKAFLATQPKLRFKHTHITTTCKGVSLHGSGREALHRGLGT